METRTWSFAAGRTYSEHGSALEMRQACCAIAASTSLQARPQLGAVDFQVDRFRIRVVQPQLDPDRVIAGWRHAERFGAGDFPNRYQWWKARHRKRSWGCRESQGRPKIATRFICHPPLPAEEPRHEQPAGYLLASGSIYDLETL